MCPRCAIHHGDEANNNNILQYFQRHTSGWIIERANCDAIVEYVAIQYIDEDSSTNVKNNTEGSNTARPHGMRFLKIALFPIVLAPGVTAPAVVPQEQVSTSCRLQILSRRFDSALNTRGYVPQWYLLRNQTDRGLRSSFIAGFFLKLRSIVVLYHRFVSTGAIV